LTEDSHSGRSTRVPRVPTGLISSTSITKRRLKTMLVSRLGSLGMVITWRGALGCFGTGHNDTLTSLKYFSAFPSVSKSPLNDLINCIFVKEEGQSAPVISSQAT